MVNNAGYTHKNQPMLDVTEEEFDRIYDVNVKAIDLAALACVPEMESAAARDHQHRIHRRRAPGPRSHLVMGRRARRSS